MTIMNLILNYCKVTLRDDTHSGQVEPGATIFKWWSPSANHIESPSLESPIFVASSDIVVLSGRNLPLREGTGGGGGGGG